MVLKRAEKAQRRKQILAARRSVESLEMSHAGQVRRAAGLPIQRCLLTQSLFENGVGMLVLARGSTPHNVTVGAFLLDPFCLGIKDIVFRSLGSEEFATYLEVMGEAAPLVAVEPGYARRLVADLATWAQSIGFTPHHDFAVVEQLFGDVSPDAGDVDYRFGHDGKPYYIPGPTESTTSIRRRMEHLRQLLGDDGFDFLVEI